MNAEFLSNSEHQPRSKRARWSLRVMMVGSIVLVIWAALANVDQVTRAPAQIIAKERTQVIQVADTGVLTKIHVQEGQVVKAGQLLATLERERAQAGVDDSRAKVAALRIALARLKAEVFERPLTFEPDLQEYPDYIRNQKDLYTRRKTAIDQDLDALGRILKLARDELQMNAPLVATGDVSRAEVMRLQRSVADISAQIANKRNKYFQDAQAEMTKVQEDLNTQTEMLRDRSQVLEHTELLSPVDGVVKNIRLTTVGAVVRSAETVMEIFPTSGGLIAEAKISPTDIGFIHVGQSASVKLDSYDYSIYGAMRGEVSYVSPDTLVEEVQQKQTPYYRVHVLIHASEFKGPLAQQIQLRPGMTATVEIKARERSVLNYLTKPITKTLNQSLGER